MQTKLTGGCLCGAVRYECSHDPGPIVVCHCLDCRKAGGAGAAYIMRVPVESVVLRQGQPGSYAKRADSGNLITRYFCTECGSQLYSQREDLPQYTALRVGSLDDAAPLEIGMHIWTSSALPWMPMDEPVPRHEKNRPA